MSVINFPTSLKIDSSTWGQTRLDVSFGSAFGSQAMEISPPIWSVKISSPPLFENESGDWQALIMNLKGQTNQLALWNHGRSYPRGTMRGTMTLNSSAAQGATSLSIIAASEVSKTLMAGDLLGIGTGATQQVVMVTALATSDGTGVIAVTIQPPLRNAFSGGASVTWDKPKALFRRSESVASWDYDTILASGFTLDLVEDWRT